MRTYVCAAQKHRHQGLDNLVLLLAVFLVFSSWVNSFWHCRTSLKVLCRSLRWVSTVPGKENDWNSFLIYTYIVSENHTNLKSKSSHLWIWLSTYTFILFHPPGDNDYLAIREKENPCDVPADTPVPFLQHLAGHKRSAATLHIIQQRPGSFAASMTLVAPLARPTLIAHQLMPIISA